MCVSRNADENLEQELRRALRGSTPLPNGFQERVLARALESERRARGRWAMAAGLAATVALGSVGEALHARALKRAEARQQFALAMHITGDVLQTALTRGLNGQIQKAAHAVEGAGR